MILNNIPLSLSVEDLIKPLRLGQRKDGRAVAAELLRTAKALVVPKVLYRDAYIDKKEKTGVRIGGVRFASRVLRTNLDHAERVFPFVLTVGGALEEKAVSSGDLLRQYYLETLADLALGSVAQTFEKYLKRRFGLGKISSMSPGSLPDWPLTEQTALFSLLGDTQAEIGVRLTDSLLMIPRKSISGLYFQTEISFVSCQLCERKRCPGRRAPFDAAMRKQYDPREE